MLVNLINFLRGFLLSATQHLKRHEAKSLKRHRHYTSPHTRLTRHLPFISLILCEISCFFRYINLGFTQKKLHFNQSGIQLLGRSPVQAQLKLFKS
ncbi:TPA: hypothetical protein F6U33_27465 [Citrobacter freundii]|nr:hypothetical protein E0E99_26610 [Citrobacter freundii]TBV91382.1 hypothetical protein E0F20_25755 [Citrobacter freundii]TKI69756.1 hypothetical protein FC759_26690 [Citrobacter freundii]HAU4306921.1 hypothetical protein [Citrobacter freundii]HAU5695250.1 hypothetical protein [Citrobacter freundii]